MKIFQILYIMMVRIAGMIANTTKESVTGAVLMDGAVEKVG